MTKVFVLDQPLHTLLFLPCKEMPPPNLLPLGLPHQLTRHAQAGPAVGHNLGSSWQSCHAPNVFISYI